MRRVIIEVRGGVAEFVEKPDDVEVVIRDYDVEGSDPSLLKEDDAGEQMTESIYEVSPYEVSPTADKADKAEADHQNDQFRRGGR